MMRKFFSKKHYKTIFLFITIMVIGFFLRHYHYRTIPRHGATFDEFAWTWLGINLIQKHTPISWSSQPQYTHRSHLIYQGAAFWIVTPYLEHPPLFGLVTGGFALLNGVHGMYDVTLSKIRPLTIFLGLVSIFLVFLLTSKLYGKKIALLAGLFYATAPTIVIGSRIVQNENFFIPMWLLSLYCIATYLESGRKWQRNCAAIIAGLLSLAKVPWITAGVSLMMILSYKKKWKDTLLVGVITLSFFLLFIAYGFYWDKELFISLWKLQTARYDINFSGFYAIFMTPLLVDRYYLDGWIFFGWSSLLLILKNFKKYFLILLPFFTYLVMYIFAIPNEPAHGWYRYPFYPFLFIMTAIVIIDEFKNLSLVSLYFLFVVGLSLFANTWETVYGFSYIIYRTFILLACFSVFPFLWFKKFENIAYILFGCWISLFIILNIFSVLLYIE
jgi:4-amino-4-deoxy-L-arabinose transferase-like glycosyltransferase